MPLRLTIALLLAALSGCARDKPLASPSRPRVAARPAAEPALIDADGASKPIDEPIGREPF